MKLFGYFVVGTVLLLSMVGCTLKNPEMPTWDINVDLPLMNEYMYVSDLVDSVHFFQDENHDVYFSSNGNIDSFDLDSLEIKPSSDVEIPLFSTITATGAMSLASMVTTNQVKVAYGRIQSGSLQIDPVGFDPQLNWAKIRFDEFYINNENLVITIPNNSSHIDYPLAGITIGTIDNTTIIDSLHYTVTNSSSYTFPFHIGDINMSLHHILSFNSFKGKMDNYTLPVETSTTEIDIEYPMGIENAIQINDAKLLLTLDNEIGFDCKLYGKLYAYNETTGDSAYIDILDASGHPFVLQAAYSVTSPRPSTFSLGRENGLNQLTNIIPTRFTIKEASFVMNSVGTSFGFANVGQKVSGTYIEDVPFDFTLFSYMITPQRLDSLEITSENRDYIRKNVNSANLILRVKNQLPIGAGVAIYFSTSSDVFQDSMLVRRKTINSGGYDSAFQEINFELSHDEIQLFDNPMIYFRTRIYIKETDGPVTIHGSSSDYIQIRGRIQMNARVEGK